MIFRNVENLNFSIYISFMISTGLELPADLLTIPGTPGPADLLTIPGTPGTS